MKMILGNTVVFGVLRDDANINTPASRGVVHMEIDSTELAFLQSINEKESPAAEASRQPTSTENSPLRASTNTTGSPSGAATRSVCETRAGSIVVPSDRLVGNVELAINGMLYSTQYILSTAN
jgi:hypothetical protein